MKRLTSAFMILLAAGSAAPAQETAATDPGAPVAPAAIVALAPGDNQGDPGYALYKEGYALVMEERWKEARARFSDLIAKYGKSDYLDDAKYWSAFCLKHTSPKDAVAAYKKFIETYRSSSYYDDAVADLQDLERGPGEAHSVGVAVNVPPVNVSVALPSMASSMRSLNRQLRVAMRGVPRPFGVSAGSPIAVAGRPLEPEKLDEKTQLKIEALGALGENEDDESFAALREIAVNPRQHRAVREAALDGLSGMSKHDVLPVLVEVARKDTAGDLSSRAIDIIGSLNIDRNRRVSTLEEIFRSIPASRLEDRQAVIYAVANVGNDRAIEFLKTVALGDGEVELRKDAVYFLGSIGTPRSRQALQEILKQ
jgi:hypothetical protein